MKTFSSLLGLFVILLLSATSYAQTVCPNCGRIHQSSFVSSTPGTYPVSVAGYLPNAAPATSFVNFSSNVNYTSNVNVTSNASFTGGKTSTVDAQSLAQQKANLAASTMNKGHVGGSLGPATHEGVGFSTVSPQQAIDAACYSGSPISAQGPARPRLGAATARGSDGWYSCLLCL
ncbi:hypothetical protein N9Y42_04840 [Mariniblastus sp.]|nr:hypothetical protein [Mariniblastus sp.]